MLENEKGLGGTAINIFSGATDTVAWFVGMTFSLDFVTPESPVNEIRKRNGWDSVGLASGAAGVAYGVRMGTSARS